MKVNSISVIIPYYNRHETIEAAIQSVLKQTCSPLEIIIIDDGSNESSSEFVHNLYQTQNIVTIIKKRNGGVSSARNLGMAISKGDYIALLDSDDYWAPTHLENAVKFLSEHTSVIATHSKFECIFTDCDKNTSLINRLTNRLQPWVDNSTNTTNFHIIEKLMACELLIKAEVAFATSSLVISRINLKSEVYFDVSLPFGEDVDFVCALALQGNIGYIDEIGSYYRIHEDNTVNIDSNLTKDEEEKRIDKLRSIEKRIIYSRTPSIKSNLLITLSHRYYLIAQSLSNKDNYAKSLPWYILSFKLNASVRCLKHIIVQKLLPQYLIKFFYKH